MGSKGGAVHDLYFRRTIGQKARAGDWVPAVTISLCMIVKNERTRLAAVLIP
jgi:hypothetical protein